MTVQLERFYPTWTLGDRLRKCRLHVHMTQSEFAEQLEVAEGTLAAWETDRAQPRRVVSLALAIQRITGIPAEWVLGLDPGPDGDGGSRLGESNPRPIHYEPAIHAATPYLVAVQEKAA